MNRRLRYVFLPAEILATLLNVVRTLNNTYKAEFRTVRESQDGMSLDQLLPVLIYVIVAAHSDQHQHQHQHHQHHQGGGRLELIPLGEWTRLTAACLLLTIFLSKLVAWKRCVGRSGRYGSELVVRCEMVRQFGEMFIFRNPAP